MAVDIWMSLSAPYICKTRASSQRDIMLLYFRFLFFFFFHLSRVMRKRFYGDFYQYGSRSTYTSMQSDDITYCSLFCIYNVLYDFRLTVCALIILHGRRPTYRLTWSQTVCNRHKTIFAWRDSFTKNFILLTLLLYMCVALFIIFLLIAQKPPTSMRRPDLNPTSTARQWCGTLT
jgi:hypothetical protein